jgi:scyllo-inositol 2-dehydrogenase (NADP+)
MRVVVVGYGVQGHKRARVAGSDLVATIDPVAPDAQHKSLSDVVRSAYDAALLCTSDAAKLALIEELLAHGKHVLVEKPLVAASKAELQRIAQLARERRLTCYTAYNHRFEPHFIRLRDELASGRLGRIYHLRMFYGNGTARLVRDSAWRDQGAGVIHDLGSHLLDTARFWFPDIGGVPRLIAANCFENRAPDHAIFALDGHPSIEAEMTLLSWRNHFMADVYAEGGSAHISSLCKWGPSTFTVRTRVLPSGRPPEDSVTLVQDDPTWDAEYVHFKALCAAGGSTSLETDIWINDAIQALDAQRRDAE